MAFLTPVGRDMVSTASALYYYVEWVSRESTRLNDFIFPATGWSRGEAAVLEAEDFRGTVCGTAEGLFAVIC